MNDVQHTALPLTPIQDATRWDEFIAAHNGHLLQTYAWGELKSRFGWRAERLAWCDGRHSHVSRTIYAAAQIFYRTLAPGLRFAYIPRGPVFEAPTTDEAVALLHSIRDLTMRRGMFLLKVEPDWLRDDPLNASLDTASLNPSDETIQPPTTLRIDLSRDREEILAAMKSKWRYNIRLAEKKGVLVRTGAADDLPAFYELMRVTGRRDHFAVHSLEYYRAAFDLLTARDVARLFVATFENKPLAMIFVTAFGHEAIYLYGASGDEQRNLMPNYALHWAAIQWAKSRGCAWYDLWGVPENADVESHHPERNRSEAEMQSKDAARLPGSLYQFKQGFGGEVVHYSGAFDAIYSLVKYAVYRAARRIRRGGLG